MQKETYSQMQNTLDELERKNFELAEQAEAANSLVNELQMVRSDIALYILNRNSVCFIKQFVIRAYTEM